jgi:hypothetical protein
MRALTVGEIEAIKYETLRLGTLNAAIKFCLGYDKLQQLSAAAERTVREVKAQIRAYCRILPHKERF